MDKHITQEIRLEALNPHASAEDEEIFREIIDTGLNERQKEIIKTPSFIRPECTSVMAVHWHPEFIPLDLIRTRIYSTFPNIRDALIIPTQHNVLITWDDYAGVEVDCFSREFNRKIQLLIHLRADRLQKASSLCSMLEHTHKYRSTQLYEYIDSIIDPRWENRVQKAASATGSTQKIIGFIRHYMNIIKELLDKNDSGLTVEMKKNRIVRDFFDCLRDRYDSLIINRCQFFLSELKKIVKAEFNLEYFYDTHEIIEEARHLNGGIIVPHPEQFWPVLLADYDIDGYEVWNPQSRQYSDFLINAVNRQNMLHASKKNILTFMGDDTHMSEKLRLPRLQDSTKAGREIGIQDGWSDPAIMESIRKAGLTKEYIIEEYKSRLN